MKNKELPPLVRVALYIRVSGEEQKIKGLSLEAQQERLEAYAREKGWIVTGIYRRCENRKKEYAQTGRISKNDRIREA